MINTKYFNGFESEPDIMIYYVHSNIEYAIQIWQGYFEILLEGCYKENFKDDGLLLSYVTVTGFYDEEVFKIKNLKTVLNELNNFNIYNIEHFYELNDLVKKVINLKNELISFFKSAQKLNEDVFIKYN